MNADEFPVEMRSSYAYWPYLDDAPHMAVCERIESAHFEPVYILWNELTQKSILRVYNVMQPLPTWPKQMSRRRDN